MSYIADLQMKIELTRKKMYKIYENDPNDPHLITTSQSLDKQLNELERLLNEEEKMITFDR
ncbi:Spo0E family sporulation regulatory protein-aspartic acid phosphatase [Oceanobacillus rekensis]|uniref:Spo0E family sporulation regulatory protein-aspartic acid phosphatase n=1 Tax=Oceanobacillus rekensis TaxID=937927 RepID=UPI001FE58542|nr:Spo0E family sporulation regulatory protein-aspartic acid phosphatase [Oceanobacillus rekensis]